MNKFLSYFKLCLPDKKGTIPIIPAHNVIKTSLTLVITIMSFLAALALGSARIIHQAAYNWQYQSVQEATIQIMPIAGQDIEQELQKAFLLAKQFPFVKQAYILSQKETEALLRPWFHETIDLDNLPLPRIVIVEFKDETASNIKILNEAVKEHLSNAYFYEPQKWIRHVLHITDFGNFLALLILGLLCTVAGLTIIFATRAALATNADIVEILHFLGTEDLFIAQQFDRHFFHIALKSSFCGTILALLLFFGISFWTEHFLTTLEGRQFSALFGTIRFGWSDALVLFILMLFISALTMIISHRTVMKQLQLIENR